ncbi:MAG: GvpL/GvpF family gas vesicle protein [Cyanobacteria bacterium P01_E01_bin.45]
MYTYAFFAGPKTTLQLPTGISGRLELVHSERMAALTEPDVNFEQVQQDDNALVQAALAHDRVMCAVFEQVPLIPLQFGTCFHSRQRLIDHLFKYQDTYLSKLDMLADCVEYCCKLTLLDSSNRQSSARLAEPDTVSPVLPTGTQANNARANNPQSNNTQANNDIQLVQAEKDDILARIAQTYPRLVAHTQGDIERAYVLIQRAEALELEEKVIRWRSQLHNWKLELGQPLPPYHFV